MMRETQKDGPKDLRPVSLEELKKHSHQAGRPREVEPGRLGKSHDEVREVGEGYPGLGLLE